MGSVACPHGPGRNWPRCTGNGHLPGSAVVPRLSLARARSELVFLIRVKMLLLADL